MISRCGYLRYHDFNDHKLWPDGAAKAGFRLVFGAVDVLSWKRRLVAICVEITLVLRANSRLARYLELFVAVSGFRPLLLSTAIADDGGISRQALTPAQ